MFKKTIAIVLWGTVFFATGCSGGSSTLSDLEQSSELEADSGKPVPNPQSEHDPYSTASKIDYTHTDWMSHIPDATPLLDMSIPGAIAPWDKGPYNIQQYITWHQVIPVKDQLTAGLRAFDMPMAVVPNDPIGLEAVGVHITGGATGSHVKDTFGAIAEFVLSHPSEAVIVRIS